MDNGQKKCVIYRLRFRGPLPIPSADDATFLALGPRVHSDLLWRALDKSYREIGAGEGVPGGLDAPALRISSALPDTDAHGPLAPLAQSEHGGAARLAQIGLVDAAQVYGRLVAIEPGRYWTAHERPRAQFDRRRGRRTKRFVSAEAWIADDAGLWLGVQFSDDRTDHAARQTFHAVLSYLGESGLGGGRSVGGGHFVVADQIELSDDHPSAQPARESAWLLSRYLPTEPDWRDGALVGAGESEGAGGAIWSTATLPAGADGGGRKRMSMLDAGSRLHLSAGGKPTDGRVVRVSAADTGRVVERVGHPFVWPWPVGVPAGFGAQR